MLINYNKYFKKATINKIIIAKFKIFFESVWIKVPHFEKYKN